MYHEFRSTSREGWKYTYTGKELGEAAKQKWAGFKAAELSLRDKMAASLKDPNVKVGNSTMKELETKILHNAENREQCLVFMHEFERRPDRDYHLSLGDVVYFDLVQEPK